MEWSLAIKWINQNSTWVFSGIGVLAFSVALSGIRWLLKRRISFKRPTLILEGLRKPIGGHLDTQNQRIDGIYKFRMMNDGETTAVLGDNPLRAGDTMDILKRELSRKRLPITLVVIPEPQHIPNILEPGKSFSFEIALGHYNNKVMKDPFLFCVYYMDVQRGSYLAKVKIRPQSGDVIRLTNKRISIAHTVAHALWNKIYLDF